MNRIAVFALSLLYLLGLLVLGILFFVAREWLPFIPKSFGPVAVGVPYFGAWGAVIISLTGVFDHEHDWDPNFWPWHVARPFIGASLGIVAVLFFLSGILAVGSQLNQTAPTSPSNLLYYVIAFLVGYREVTFRELIKKLADVVIGPGGQAWPVPAITGLNPPNAPHDVPTPVVITGSAFTGTQSVTFGSAAAQFTVNSDAQLTATTPTTPNALNVPVTITTKGGSATYQPFQMT